MDLWIIGSLGEMGPSKLHPPQGLRWLGYLEAYNFGLVARHYAESRSGVEGANLSVYGRHVPQPMV